MSDKTTHEEEFLAEAALDTFNQLEAEVIEKYPIVESFFYNAHMGTWDVRYTDRDEDEAEDFNELLTIIKRKQDGIKGSV